MYNYWGEPERAPHRRVERSQSIYYYYYYYYNILLLWYVRHPRAAIEIVQEYIRDIFQHGLEAA